MDQTAKETLEALVRERVDATARRDAATLASREAAHVRTFNVLPPLELSEGAPIEELVQGWLDSYAEGPTLEITRLTVDAEAELGYAAYLYRVSGTLKSGDPVNMWVRATTIYRLLDGQWRIVHDHESVPYDPETGQALTGLDPRAEAAAD